MHGRFHSARFNQPWRNISSTVCFLDTILLQTGALVFGSLLCVGHVTMQGYSYGATWLLYNAPRRTSAREITSTSLNRNIRCFSTLVYNTNALHIHHQNDAVL